MSITLTSQGNTASANYISILTEALIAETHLSLLAIHDMTSKVDALEADLFELSRDKDVGELDTLMSCCMAL